VVTGRRLRAPGLFSLQIDDRHGAMLAVRHLIEIGHRKIAFIAGSENHPDAVERFRDIKRRSKTPELISIPSWWRSATGTRKAACARRSICSVRKSNSAPFFCVNDQTAYGACLALYRKGLSVPGDVSVIGFDDLPSSTYRLPPLTSVRQSIGELGDRSAQAILQLTAGRRPRIDASPRRARDP